MIHHTSLIGTADFSDCGKYRWKLTRCWDSSLPSATIMGVNPSIAGALGTDPTITRSVGFARDAGFGSFTMLNPFCYISTDICGLPEAEDPVGEFADRMILEDTSDMLIWASGPPSKVPKHLRYRFDEVEKMLRARRKLYALSLTKSGWPAHPLMLPATCRPFEWTR